MKINRSRCCLHLSGVLVSSLGAITTMGVLSKPVIPGERGSCTTVFRGVSPSPFSGVSAPSRATAMGVLATSSEALRGSALRILDRSLSRSLVLPERASFSSLSFFSAPASLTCRTR